jgi:ABC-type phosphate/phosphonate transport system substrate-binding protein
LVTATLAFAAPPPKEPAPDPVKIGLCGSLTREFSDAVALASTRPLRAIIQAQTGLATEFAIVGESDKLADQLVNQQVKLAVFQGVEFAWARQKHPKLCPLIIAVNQQPQLYAHVMVRQESAVANFADLKDQSLALPLCSREHCRAFCDGQVRASGKATPQFFRLTTPQTSEEALDNVAEGTVQAAVVDGMALECYKRRKPGRFGTLKELQKSEGFPATVIAYQAGSLDEATLKRFREKLIACKQNPLARQVFLLWRLTAFEPIPEDYENCLTTIAKKYPAPRDPCK